MVKGFVEVKTKVSDNVMVNDLVGDVEGLIKSLTAVASSIDEKEDRNTINLLDTSIGTLEGHAWILRSFLK